ncbi:hypothetical protein ACXWR7_11930, partial [Streptococcus pyogenes]
PRLPVAFSFFSLSLLSSPSSPLPLLLFPPLLFPSSFPLFFSSPSFPPFFFFFLLSFFFFSPSSPPSSPSLPLPSLFPFFSFH